jgi:hypothetical protein
MTDGPGEPWLDLLDEVVADLFRGDWRSATLTLRDYVDAGDHPALVAIVFCLRCVTRSMRLQSVVAEVESAWHQLQTAAARLSDIPAADVRSARTAQLLPRMDLLIERELADLRALRAIVEDLSKGTDELVVAYVEFLTLVEFDPFTFVLHHLESELTGFTSAQLRQWRGGRRTQIVVRATNLRCFAGRYDGSVSERTWARAGGSTGIRQAAFGRLAAEPLCRGLDDLDIDDVKLGRRYAWEHAHKFPAA